MKDKIHKKKYKTDINQLSYNKKNLIQESWKKLKTINEISDENYYSDSTLSEKDSNYNSDSDDIKKILYL
jgi:hypothetical protein